MNHHTLKDLANEVAASCEILCSWLKQEGYPQPSFNEDGPASFPQSDARQTVQDARAKLIGAASDLSFLAQWPADAARSFANRHAFDAESLRVVIHLDIAQHVPLEGNMGFAQLAGIVDVDEERLTRIMRYAMTNHWFCEPEPGKVAHTAMSSLLVKDKAVAAQVKYQSQIGVPSSHRWIDSIRASREDPSYHNSPFNLAFQTDKQSMTWASEDPIKRVWFNDMIESYAQSTQFGLHHTVNGFDWASLKDGLLVDVGGNTGAAAMAIAEVAAELRIVVQDRPGQVAKGKAELSPEFAGRITFQEHDFFQKNPVDRPEAFLLRNVLHDWPDQYAIAILQNLFQAMGPFTKLFIADSVMPPPGALPASAEKSLRVLDMTMMTMMNAKERTADDWTNLIQRVDAAAEIIRIQTPPGSALSIIEVARKSS